MPIQSFLNSRSVISPLFSPMISWISCAGFFIISVLFLFPLSTSATTYYVSATGGKDTWSGKLPTSSGGDGPWQTLEKINTSSFLPGDSILFRCGEKWIGGLAIPSSGAPGKPITVGAYGTPCTEKPTISGAYNIEGWTLESGSTNVYVASVNPTRFVANVINEGTFDTEQSSLLSQNWASWSGDKRERLLWVSDCGEGKTGCLQVQASPSAQSLVSSNSFSVIAGKEYTVQFDVRGERLGQVVGVFARRNGPTYETIGLAKKPIAITQSWASNTYTFFASATLANARIDFEVQAGESIFVDNVRVTPRDSVQQSIEQVFMDKQYADLAHHPNRGFLSEQKNDVFLSIGKDSPVNTTTNPQGDSTLLIGGSDMVLTPAQQSDMLGAGIHIRTNAYIIDDRVVAGYEPVSKTFSLDKPSSYGLFTGWGYYLDNKRSLLDSPGEWYYDQILGKLYVWTPDGKRPEGRIEAGYVLQGIDIRTKSYITIDGLRIEKMGTGIDSSYSDGVIIRNVAIADSHVNGIRSHAARNGFIEYSTIERSVREGIWVQKATSFEIRNNNIQSSGTVGTPKRSFGAIYAEYGNNILIQKNNIFDSGYIGIYGMGTSVDISSNYVENSCVVLDDCGAIYTYTPRGVVNNANAVNIAQNIVVRSIGNSFGRPTNTSSAAQGIYLDSMANGTRVFGNTIIDADYGIQVHDAHSNVFEGNVVYGNRRGSVWIQEDQYGWRGVVHDNAFTNNQFFPLPATPAFLLTSTYDTIEFGSYARNRYSSLYNAEIIQQTYKPGGVSQNTAYPLARWQTERGKDSESTIFDTFGIAPVRIQSSTMVNIIPNGAFDAGTKDWFRWPASILLAEEHACVSSPCMNITTSSDSGLANSGSFSLQSGKTYVLSFALLSRDQDVPVTVVIRRNGPTYEDVGLNTTIIPDTQWETFTKSFTAKTTLSNARVDFSVGAGKKITIDSVSIIEATVESNDIKDDSVIVYNKGDSTQTISCPNAQWGITRCGEYVDFLTGQNVLFPIELLPAQSRIFIWSKNPFEDVNRDGLADFPDVTSPLSPVNLTGRIVSTTIAELSWPPSTDPAVPGHTTSGIAGYHVHRNGTQIASVANTSYNDTNLSPDTTYTYAISAYDAVGNTSPLSPPLSVTTPASSVITPSTTSTPTPTVTPEPTPLPVTPPTVTITPPAGITGLTGSITTPTQPTFPTLTGPFGIGQKSDQVKLLQQMLIADGSFQGVATGYYGSITQRAVETFQKKYNMVTSGTPATTGYGLAGPSTRAKLNQLYASGSGGSMTSSTDRELLLASLRKQVEELGKILQGLIAKLAAMRVGG